jgi:hypothetical protein
VGYRLAGPALQLLQGCFAYFVYSARQESGQPTFAVVGTDPTAIFLVYDTIMGVASAVSACRCACTGTLTHMCAGSV